MVSVVSEGCIAGGCDEGRKGEVRMGGWLCPESPGRHLEGADA